MASPHTRQVASARLIHLQRALGKKGYSARAAEAIAMAYRPLTPGRYDVKWRSFETYCTEKAQDPTIAISQTSTNEVSHNIIFLWLRAVILQA